MKSWTPRSLSLHSQVKSRNGSIVNHGLRQSALKPLGNQSGPVCIPPLLSITHLSGHWEIIDQGCKLLRVFALEIVFIVWGGGGGS